jgi:uncharacterized protein
MARISDNWAEDIAEKSSDGIVTDNKVIQQSITAILFTIAGERIFFPFFGAGLQRYLFDNMNAAKAEEILDRAASQIKRWEDRIDLQEDQMRLISNADENSVTLVIPYIIKRTNISSTYSKKIYSNG